jgi:serine/threonine protein kinase/Leucine-rich repeat (LRR) protein
MAVSLEQFLKQLEDTGILGGDTLQEFRPPKSTLKHAEELSFELVRHKKLTKFQAEQIYLGHAKSLLLGNYLLMDKIGTGGMGQVFKARHRRMDRIVAVKLLPSQTNKNPEVIARFEREVKTVAKFSHPNIVAAYDADCANGRHFLVMEFVEGRDLSAIVKSIGPLSLEQALNYILQSARGLEAAHAQGIIHRDIKPANLLLDKKGIVKVLDLGIARLTDDDDGSHQAELTSMGMVLGTPAYMAPEQALDPKTADVRADIYALGCSLFYFLTGKSAYEGDTMLKRLVAHREQPIPSLRTIRRDIPEQVEALFRKMIAKNPEDRYQTMTEVIEALESCGRSLELTLNTPLPLGSSTGAFDIDPMLFLDDDGSSDPTIPVHTKKVTKPLPPKHGRKFFFIGGGIFGVLIFLSVLVVKLKTKEGTLVVTINEPDADVQVLNESGKIEITRKGEKDPITISVDPGKHRLKVGKEGFELFTQDFSLESGGKQQLTAKLVPLEEKLAYGVTKPVPGVVTKSAPAIGVKKPLAFEAPGFDEWVNEVAALTAEKQVEAVSRKLVELNPGFDGKLTDSSGNDMPKIENRVVTELGFAADKVSDISPVRALSGLKALFCYSKSGSGRLSDLSPVKGMSLATLKCANTKISDLSPLQGMKLKSLSCYSTRISDLSPLRGMKLTRLNCAVTNVSDLSPLQGMPLLELYCPNTHVSDLSPLQGMPLTILNVSQTDVVDLSPVQGMPLTTLLCDRTEVSDLSPLRESQLTSLILTPKNITKGMDVIRQMKIVHTIGVFGDTPMPSGEFWKKYDAGEFGKPKPAKSITDINDPAFQRWMKDVDALPAEKQVEAVSQKLVELNPGFDGKLTDWSAKLPPKIENGVVTELGFLIDKVTDISPVRALAQLRNLNCHGSSGGDGILNDLSPIQGMNLLYLLIQSRNVRDLTPLAGMPLHALNCQHCPVKDLSPLRMMPLKRLVLSETKVADLSPLDGMKLNELYLDNTRVKDISVLKGMPVRNLKINRTQVTDLSPLQEIPLTSLSCQHTQVSDLSPLKGMPLSILICNGSPISDLSPLRELELAEIYFSPDEITNGLDAIRQMKTLESIGDGGAKRFSPEEFWKKYDAGEFGKPVIP